MGREGASSRRGAPITQVGARGAGAAPATRPARESDAVLFSCAPAGQEQPRLRAAAAVPHAAVTIGGRRLLPLLPQAVGAGAGGAGAA